MKGSQEPRWSVEPARSSTDGGDAAELMAAYGYRLDPWQQTVLDCWLGIEAGRYSMTSGGLSVPRQNGKNVILEAREFFGLVINGEKILHTAHQVRTSKKSFRRLVQMFTNKRHPEITELVRQIRFTNGEEAIELINGGSIEFSSRSRQAARGYDAISLVIYDEAQELTDDQMEAIMATLSASATGTRQIIYTGTPPYPGCPGDVFRRRRDISMTSPGAHDAWHEWSVSANGLDDIHVEDTGLWYNTNPALGIRLTEEFTAEERRTLSADGFARERLGWWAPALANKTESAIPKDVWDRCASDELRPKGKTAYAVKFTADGSEVVLCGAICPPDGKARISLIERKPTGHGTRWLAEWLNERYTSASCVVIDGRNGVDVLAERLSDVWRAKGSVIRPSARDVVAAVSTLTNELNEQTVTWYRLQAALQESALSAIRRPLAGGWAFGGDDPAPIEGCALALWGCRTSKRDPSRKMRIG